MSNVDDPRPLQEFPLPAPASLPYPSPIGAPPPASRWEAFDRGGRPATLAIGCVALAYHFVIAPALGLPRVGEAELVILAGIMATFAGMRTAERLPFMRAA